MFASLDKYRHAFLVGLQSNIVYRWNFAARMVSGLLVFLPLLVAMPVIYSYLTYPLDAWRFALALPAIALSAMIQFSIAYCFGMLTFWFLEIQGFVILSMAVEMVLGGQF